MGILLLIPLYLFIIVSSGIGMVSLDLSVKHIVSVLFCNTIGVDSHILVY